jgi:surface antigen
MATGLLFGLAGPVVASTGPAAGFPGKAAVNALEQLARIDGIECVPYARAISGIHIYGDARTWWDQSKGLYSRGRTPRVGAVMTFRPWGHMTLGHVAAVSRIVDSRTVLLRHANWSPINGRRGQVERDVPAVDVSPDNDWSEVRVWFDPARQLGSTAWPVEGFIYPGGKDALAENPHHGDIHGVEGDPIGAIIAAWQSRAVSARAKTHILTTRPVPKPPAGGAVVTSFTLPPQGEHSRSHRAAGDGARVVVGGIHDRAEL